jgi:Domain of unknown function (DUF3395)
LATTIGAERAIAQIAKEFRDGKPVDVNTILSRWATNRNGNNNRQANASLNPIKDTPSVWGTVIDIAGVLQTRVDITLRDMDSEAPVIQLILPAGPKCNGMLEGVWDPSNGDEKALWLRYEFLGHVHEAIIDDEAPLKCPLKSMYYYSFNIFVLYRIDSFFHTTFYFSFFSNRTFS